MRLIALTGKAGAGKDTVADRIAGLGELGQCGELWFYAFADPIRAMLDELLWLMREIGDWEDRDWKERQVEALSKSPRQLAQTLGTDWGRQLVHPDIWLRCAAAKAEEAARWPADLLVITDCRFENEAAWIRSRGGEVWHILRPQASPVAAHVSEAGVAVAPGDSIIDNSGTLDELNDQVRRALAGELKVETKGK